MKSPTASPSKVTKTVLTDSLLQESQQHHKSHGHVHGHTRSHSPTPPYISGFHELKSILTVMNQDYVFDQNSGIHTADNINLSQSYDSQMPLLSNSRRSTLSQNTSVLSSSSRGSVGSTVRARSPPRGRNSGGSPPFKSVRLKPCRHMTLPWTKDAQLQMQTIEELLRCEHKCSNTNKQIEQMQYELQNSDLLDSNSLQASIDKLHSLGQYIDTMMNLFPLILSTFDDSDDKADCIRTPFTERQFVQKAVSLGVNMVAGLQRSLHILSWLYGIDLANLNDRSPNLDGNVNVSGISEVECIMETQNHNLQTLQKQLKSYTAHIKNFHQFQTAVGSLYDNKFQQT